MNRPILHRAVRQHALAADLRAIAESLDRITGELCVYPIFPARDAYTEGQVNSCLIVARQQLDAVISIIRDCGEETAADEDSVLPVVERRGQPSGKRGLEAAPAAKAGVVSARKRAGARVVSGGAR
jgi:hypothetical protein